MKKMIRRIAALICIITLFAAPATALASTSTPVIVYQDDTTKMYMFQPDPYYLKAGSAIILQDTTNAQKWSVPAGMAFFTEFELKPYGSFTVQIYKLEPTIHLIYTETFSPYWSNFSHNIYPTSSDANYLVVVTALTDIYITGYTGMIYDF